MGPWPETRVPGVPPAPSAVERGPWTFGRLLVASRRKQHFLEHQRESADDRLRRVCVHRQFRNLLRECVDTDVLGRFSAVPATLAVDPLSAPAADVAGVSGFGACVILPAAPQDDDDGFERWPPARAPALPAALPVVAAKEPQPPLIVVLKATRSDAAARHILAAVPAAVPAASNSGDMDVLPAGHAEPVAAEPLRKRRAKTQLDHAPCFAPGRAAADHVFAEPPPSSPDAGPAAPWTSALSEPFKRRFKRARLLSVHEDPFMAAAACARV